jgi:hypothetical protein
VGAESDRVGLRLTGSRVDRVEDWRGFELASEGMVRGAVQVPPGGEPVVFLADHPVTGGYPVVAVLTEAPPTARRSCDPASPSASPPCPPRTRVKTASLGSGVHPRSGKAAGGS